MLRSFYNFWLPLADMVTTGIHNLMYLVEKLIMLPLLSLSLSLRLSLADAEKTHYFVHLSFNSTLQLINGISSDL